MTTFINKVLKNLEKDESFDRFKHLLGRYERDKQYLSDTLKLNPSIQNISESEKEKAINDTLTQFKSDIDAMRLAEKLIHGFRLQAYDENNFFHITINYMDDEDPRKSMNEAIYKTLDKFYLYVIILWVNSESEKRFINGETL